MSNEPVRLALEERHAARRDLVAKHMADARKEHRKLFGTKEYDSKVAESFQRRLGEDNTSLRQRAFGEDKVELSPAFGGVKMRVHRDEQVKPYLEPQQEYAREGSQPDQTPDQFGTSHEDLVEVSRTAPAPHTPDNLVTKLPDDDGFSDLDRYGYTEDLEIEEPEEKKKKKKKSEE